jgi:hypothetical protein
MPFSLQVNGQRRALSLPVPRLELPAEPGVYLIVTASDVPIYVGGAPDLHDAVNGGHPEEVCWRRAGYDDRVRYLRIEGPSAREAVVRRAVAKWRPPCNFG